MIQKTDCTWSLTSLTSKRRRWRSTVLSHWRQTAKVLAFALLLPVALPAQTASSGVIRGRIQNSVTGNYLLNARVQVVGTNIEAFTNEAGEYLISNAPSGACSLKVFYTGLEQQTKIVTVAPGEKSDQDFQLSRPDLAKSFKEGETITLDAFTVSSQRETDAASIAINEQRFAANKKEVISTDAFGQINQGNIGEFLKHVSGVSFEVKDGISPSGIMVRGFNPNYTNVTMDGGSMASTLIADTQTSSRQFLLEQASINNLSRIEVTKLPTADMPGNSLGGSVNLVSKSAFERPGKELSFAAFVSANSQDINLVRTPGPGSGRGYHTLPSFDLTYVNPVSRRLGYVVSLSRSSQFTVSKKTVPVHRFSAGGTIEAPLKESIAGTASLKQADKDSGSIKVDYKPWNHSTLEFTALATYLTTESNGSTRVYTVGNNTPVSYDANNTYGSIGANGTGRVSLSGTSKYGNSLARLVSSRYTFRDNGWIVELAGSWSNSNNRTRDMDKGMFGTMNAQTLDVRTVNLLGINGYTGSAGKLVALDASGNAVDATKLGSYIGRNLSSNQNFSQDTVREARLNVTRQIDVFGIPISIKTGGSSNDLVRDTKYWARTYTYVGPNGTADDADNNFAAYSDPLMSGVSPGYGIAGGEWYSPWKTYDAYKTNPSYFQFAERAQGDFVKAYATRSPLIRETVESGYTMADSKFWNNRIRLVAGVRYEKTSNDGWGYLQDPDAVYQRDANGSFLRDARGNRIRKSEAGANDNNPVAQGMIYGYRNAHVKRSYGNTLPSAHASINITENLLARAAFAKTVGRPRLSDVVPNFYVGENTAFDGSGYPGWIVTNNTSLVPWTAKNYDYSLEYYLPKNGLLSAAFFKKDIRNFFSNSTITADAALIERLGLPDECIGYSYQTRFNGGNAEVKGWELSASVPLSYLGAGLLEHFMVNANMTHVDKFGPNSTITDFQSFIPRNRNVGLCWIWPRFSGSVFVNWSSRMLRENKKDYFATNIAGYEYVRPRYQLDVTLDYRVDKHFTVFLAGNNILNGTYEWEVAGDVAPKYSWLRNSQRNGAQYSLGVRGSF